MDLPLFPLPNVVLFPGQVLPLYVFEPRYRELLARVQASGEPFGIVRIVTPRDQSPLPFHERVARVGTLAHLREVQTHEDGTSSISVVGGERFEIKHFDLSHAYLAAAVTVWPLPPGQPSPRLCPEGEDTCARRLLSGLLRSRPADASLIRQRAPETPLLLASFAAALLPLSPDEREKALTAPTLLDRLDLLLRCLPERELN